MAAKSGPYTNQGDRLDQETPFNTLKKVIPELIHRLSLDDLETLLAKNIINVAQYEEVNASKNMSGRIAAVRKLMEILIRKSPQEIRGFFFHITLPDEEKRSLFGPFWGGESTSSAPPDSAQPVRSAETERGHVNGTDQVAAAHAPGNENDGGDQMAQVRRHDSFKRLLKEKPVAVEDVPEKPHVEVGLCIIVSKNESEFDAVRYHLKAHPSHPQVLKYESGHHEFPLTFYLGSMAAPNGNSYSTALVQCDQGSMSMSKPGSSFVARRCIDEWKPKFLTTIGVAFGTPHHIAVSLENTKDISINKQLRIADVLVSETIITIKERHGPDHTKSRSEPVKCFEGIRRLDNVVSDYNADESRQSQVVVTSTNQEQRRSKAFIGPMLSSEELINNADEHRRLVRLHSHTPKVIMGGEMEGAGILEACRQPEEKKVEFLIIKGISDWGDGSKNSEMQAVAAHEAMAFFLRALPKIASCCHINQVPDPEQ